MMRVLLSLLFLSTVPCVPAAGETVGTFTLDGLSFVSFQDEEVLPLGAGSTIRFHFGAPQGGLVPFRISPGDVSIAPIELPDARILRYTLAAATSGTMRQTSDGAILAFTAEVDAAVEGGTSPGTRRYRIPFTTETASASDLSGGRSVEVRGLRVVDGPGHAQIVGATPNQAQAYPKPATAVYVVLSGQLDRLP